jgi:predicted nucleic acid-binding protein
MDLASRGAVGQTIVFRRLPGFAADPDDEFVLDLAAQRGATILTYNKRDFAGAAMRGVDVLTPAEFLESLKRATK